MGSSMIMELGGCFFRHILLILSLVGFVLAENCTNSSTRTITVDSTSSATSLSEELERAGRMSIFNVYWVGAVRIDFTFEISNSTTVHVTGSSSEESTIDGGDVRQLFDVDDASTLYLANISLARGRGKDINFMKSGGAIHITDDSSLIALDCVFENNMGNNGGAIFSVGSRVSIGGKTSFLNNRAVGEQGGHGGAISGRPSSFGARKSNLAIRDHVSFRGNSATSDGGALEWQDGDFLVQDASYFIGNIAGARGGAMYVKGAALVMKGNSFCSDNNSKMGGVTYMLETKANFQGDMTCSNNTSEQGGAFFLDQSTTHVLGHLKCSNNEAVAFGGAFLMNASNTFIDGEVACYENEARSAGGAIYTDKARINVAGRLLLNDNTARSFGGGIRVFQSVVIFKGYVMMRNNVAHTGGAFYTREKGLKNVLTLSGQVEIIENEATSGSGGAIYAWNTHITGNGALRFERNRAKQYGGAIYARYGKVVLRGKVLLVDNTAGKSGDDTYSTTGTMFELKKQDFTEENGEGPRFPYANIIYPCIFVLIQSFL